MSDLISRQDAKDAIDMALDHIDHVPPWVYDKLLNALNEVPSAEKAQLSEEDATKDATSDLISRKKALDVIRALQTYKLFEGDDMILVDKADVQTELMMLPSAEPERLTDDDFETIRLHLNAQKEKLCNQRRWEEAEEYQRIIDRFMAFASAQPERKTAEWIYGENGGQDGWYCSKCGLFIPWDYEYYGLDNIDFIADFHTCPKCDRKMLKYTGMRGERE